MFLSIPGLRKHFGRLNEPLKDNPDLADEVTAPHEYAVRGKNPFLEDEFVYFVKYIRKHGYEEKFWSKAHTYYNVGEYKYWTMGNPIDETTIINRAAVKSTSEEKQHIL